jgi:hypothetical protein
MNTKSILVAAVLMSLSTFTIASCEPGSFTSENRKVETNFFGIILKTNAQVIFSQGTENSVRIEGDKKTVSSVETVVENGALVISGRNETPVTIYITADDISLLEVEGSGRIFSSRIINSDMLLLKVVGSGSIHVDVRTLSLGMIVKGNGKIYAKGSTGDSFTRVMGNGQIVAMNLDSFKTTSEVINDNGWTGKADASATKHAVLRIHQ